AAFGIESSRREWSLIREKLSRVPLLGRLWSAREPLESRPHGYDLIGDLDEDLDPEFLPPAKQQAAHAALLESLR
ncbi:MAG: hypothetical protein AAF725_19445, partial [Acidobacteriota bacterium]